MYSNKEKKKYSQEYYKTHKEKYKEHNQEYYQTHKEKHKEYYKIYHKTHKKERNEYERGRRKNDPNHKLIHTLRDRLYKAVKRNTKSGSAVRDLGCTISELKLYLEKQFTEGMNWTNHGEWHIDHRIPLFSFDLTNREELLKAVNYTNLQPLWKIDNIRKSSKLS